MIPDLYRTSRVRKTRLGNSALLTPGSQGQRGRGSAEPDPTIALPSPCARPQCGMDYTALKEHLVKGEYQLADDETRALLIKLAGPDAVKRGWVYFTEASQCRMDGMEPVHQCVIARRAARCSQVKFIPVADLQTIDQLWKAYSNGKFGFSVQREMWLQNKKQWQKFFKRIDWTVGEKNIYRKWPAEFKYTNEAVK